MSSLEESLSQVLGDPQMMQKIMSLAQSLGQQPQEQPPPQEPLLDLKNLAGLANLAAVDKDQQALLRALGPYISRERRSKLERAMRAAKMATAASSMLLGR